MNMNKTILATLITTAFSSNVIAQSVDTGSHTEQSGVAYEQDDSSAWKAVGGGALALTAAVLSGSSSSSSNGSSDELPPVDNDIPRDIDLITHGDTAYMYVNGEEVRNATLQVTSEGNYTITGSEGAMLHVTGDDVLVTMVNGESVKLHNVIRTDDRNISFSVAGENYNLHRTYSGEVWVQKEQGNGTGDWVTVKTGADVLANIQERQLINAIDKTLPDVDNLPIKPETSGSADARKFSKNIDRTKLQNIKTQVMNRLAK